MGVLEERSGTPARAGRVRWSTRRRLVVATVALAAIAFGVLRLVPSGDYLFLPHETRPVDPLVRVPDEPADAGTEVAADSGGIYMVDILVRKASLLDRLFPGLSEGADVVPGENVNPAGVSEEQRNRQADLQMATSQEISGAVALRALGYQVAVTTVGAQVTIVRPESDAYGKLQPGDVIVRADGEEVRTLADLREALEDVRAGDPVTLAVRDAEGLQELTVVTRESDTEPGRGVIGVQVQDAAQVRLPVDVEIDAGDVGGPSAALAFALGIVDELGPEVDRGRTVVVTGALDLEGNVIAIGGMKQKAIGAVRAGADVIVVPAGNADEAREYAGDVPVIAVETFAQALDGLGVEL